MTARGTRTDPLEIEGYAAVRAFALSFPEAYEEFPWGHSAIKVRKKIFLTLGATDDGFSMSLKLTDSNFEALLLPFTEPTHYGMGKHGWVTSHFSARATAPLATLRSWVEESYRAVAPKKLVARLDEEGLPKSTGSAARRTTRKKPIRKVSKKKTSKKRPAAKKTAEKKTAAGRKRPPQRP